MPRTARKKSCKQIYHVVLRGINKQEKSMKEYIYEKNEDQCMEIDETVRRRVTDEEAKRLISKELGGVIPAIGKAKERKGLNGFISRLIHAGISIRQLSRLTGKSKKIIENVLE